VKNKFWFPDEPGFPLRSNRLARVRVFVAVLLQDNSYKKQILKNIKRYKNAIKF